MNRTDLIMKIAFDTGLTKAATGRVVDSLTETIIGAVAGGKDVSIMGFGSFRPKIRLARRGVNPSTGEKITIQAAKVPSFRPGQGFRDAVKNSKKAVARR